MKKTPDPARADTLSSHVRGLFVLILVLAIAGFGPMKVNAGTTVDYPELGELKEIISLGRPSGIVFLVREHSEDAYDWILPRLERYVALVREHWPDLPVAVVSHGEEIFSLLKERQPANAAYREQIEQLVMQQDVAFQICGAFAALSGLDASHFIDPVEVVDSAPYQIMDYRALDYRVLHLELTW